MTSKEVVTARGATTRTAYLTRDSATDDIVRAQEVNLLAPEFYI